MRYEGVVGATHASPNGPSHSSWSHSNRLRGCAMEEQPQRRPVSKGTCSFCGGAFSKSTMARHLAACPRRAAAMPAPAGGRLSRQKGFHLVVAGRYRPEYWLHL